MNQDTELYNLMVEYFDVLTEELDQIEALVLSDKLDIITILRMIHTIKGTAGIYDMDLVTTICHQLEDLLVDQDQDQRLTKQKELVILKRLDSIRTVVKAINDSDNEKIKELSDSIKMTGVPGATTSVHHILLVDNSKIQKKMIARYLQSLDIHISYCDSSLVAIERLMNENFDSLITSLELKGFDGLSLIRANKVIESHNKDIPSILITSSGIKCDSEIKADRIISKGSDLFEELGEFYNKLLNNKPVRSVKETIVKELSNIMFVDDSLEIQKLISVSFKIAKSNIDFSFQNDGIPAIAALRKNRPDLIIMDVNMLEMNGPETLKIIRTEISKDIPIFFLTAENDDQKFKDLDYQGVLKKPFNPQEFVKEILLAWKNIK